MKKQSGFTLIELMVVMAIIAILATAGLSAYTGYIKKARDTTRIADISAINNIILATLTTTGSAPTIANLRSAITAANNNIAIYDPLATGSATVGPQSCLVNGAGASTTGGYCNYIYQTCDSDTTYRILARFESAANKGLYNVDAIATGATSACAAAPGTSACLFYAVGSCGTGATSPTTETTANII